MPQGTTILQLLSSLKRNDHNHAVTTVVGRFVKSVPDGLEKNVYTFFSSQHCTHSELGAVFL